MPKAMSKARLAEIRRIARRGDQHLVVLGACDKECAACALNELLAAIGTPREEWGYGYEPHVVTPTLTKSNAKAIAVQQCSIGIKAWKRLVGGWHEAELDDA